MGPADWKLYDEIHTRIYKRYVHDPHVHFNFPAGSRRDWLFSDVSLQMFNTAWRACLLVHAVDADSIKSTLDRLEEALYSFGEVLAEHGCPDEAEHGQGGEPELTA